MYSQGLERVVAGTSAEPGRFLPVSEGVLRDEAVGNDVPVPDLFSAGAEMMTELLALVRAS